MAKFVPLVYDELRALARRYFRRQRPGFTLRPTEMVNEACLHLMQHARGDWQSPEHFRAIATRKIWQVLIDHIKRRNARKRGGARRPNPADTATGDTQRQRTTAIGDSGWRKVGLDTVTVEWHDRPVEIMDLAEALDALGEHHERLREVVMLHWFGGMRYDDVAGVLSVSSSTVEKDFRYALAWLNRRLSEQSRDGH